MPDGSSAYTVSVDLEDSYVTPIETYMADDKPDIYVFTLADWEARPWAELIAGEMWKARFSHTGHRVIFII